MFEKPFKPSDKSRDAVGKQMFELARKYELEGREVRSVERIKDSIKEKILKDIYTEMLTKSGVGNRLVNFVNLRSIKTIFDKDALTLGSFNFKDNSILLNAAHFPQVTQSALDFLKSNSLLSNRDLDSLKDDLYKLCILGTVIHEENHALSNRGCLVGNKVTVIGFQNIMIDNLSTINNAKITEFGRNINEGFTELLSFNVLEEYLKRTGDVSSNVVDTYINGPTHLKSAYEKYVMAAKYYVTFISALGDISYQTAENALFRSYLRGEFVIPEEVLATLFELGKTHTEIGGFIADICNLEHIDNYELFINSTVKKLPPEERIKYWLAIEAHLQMESVNPQTRKDYV